MFCKSPYTGIVINPTGDINVCCSAPNSLSLKHVSKVDDLHQFFKQDEILNELRNDNRQAIDWICKSCIQSESVKQRSRRISYNKNKFANNQTYLKYLEVTTSNICNQTCSTCSSFYSSKWSEYDYEYKHSFPDRIPHKLFKLSNKDIDTIIKVIPQLEYLSIKGGEPFADKNNILLLEAVQRLNPSCNVLIVSNFHHIPTKVMQTCSELSNLKVTASIDGIGDLYRWIRSTDFDKTEETLDKFYQVTGHQISLSTTISLYNYFNLIDILKYFNGKDYLKRLTTNKITSTPNYISVYSLPEKWIEYGKNKFINEFNKLKLDTPVENYDCMFNVKPKYVNPNLKNVIDWMENINRMRGFNIEDLVPELNEMVSDAKT